MRKNGVTMDELHQDCVILCILAEQVKIHVPNGSKDRVPSRLRLIMDYAAKVERNAKEMLEQEEA